LTQSGSLNLRFLGRTHTAPSPSLHIMRDALARL
jgi:hypothetical protein